MINFTNKKILDLRDVILIAFFMLGLIGFLNFESLLYNFTLKIVVVVIGLLLVFTFILMKNEVSDFFATVILFLSFYNLYNLYYSLNWPLWLLMIIGIILTISIFNLLFWSVRSSLTGIYLIIYSLLLVLMMLEFFLSLIYWPIDPKSKSLMLVAVFYVLGGVLHLKIENNMNWKTITPYGIISLIVLALTITTSIWNN
jgi:hypothetical protein